MRRSGTVSASPLEGKQILSDPTAIVYAASRPPQSLESGALHVRQLEAFLTVAKLRSLRQAARVLFVTQPAVGSRIRNLEQEVGAELFHRSAAGVELTAAGRAFLPYAQRALWALTDGRQQVAALREGRVGQLVIAATPAASIHVLPAIMARFHAHYPDVRVVVRSGRSEDVLDMVMRDHVQLGLIREVPHIEALSVPVFEDEVVLVASSTHRLARRRAITLSELAKENLVTFDRTTSYFGLTAAVFSGDVVPTGSLEVDNAEAAMKMVEFGLGAALLPLTTVTDQVASGRLITIDIVDAPTVRYRVVAVRRADPLDHPVLVEQFLDVASISASLNPARGVPDPDGTS